MKLKMIFASFFLAWCAVCFSSAETFAQQQETRVPLKRSRSFMDGSYAYKFTEQDFVGAPVWNQADGEPPLSISRAVKAARESLPRFVKNAEAWKLSRVSLENMGDDIWYYRVHFFCLGQVCRDIETRGFTSIVKMDGNIIEPKTVTIEK